MRMTAAEVNAFIDQGLPGFRLSGLSVAAVGDQSVTVVQAYRDDQLRPGGSLSGPTLMALADTAMYALILAQLGPVAMAVTQNLNIHFLRRPQPADVQAEARFLRLGRRSAVIDVVMTTVGDSTPVAHATGTYALPVAESATLAP